MADIEEGVADSWEDADTDVSHFSLLLGLK